MKVGLEAISKKEARELSRILRQCAEDLQLALEIEESICRGRQKSIITLYVDIAISDEEEKGWCLACSLACFCPDARVVADVVQLNQDAI